MPSLRLESSTDIMPLDDVFNRDEGAEALAGVTGLGLPPVAAQYAEGAGHGAKYRGKRYLPRDIDLPLYFEGNGRDGLKDLMRRMAIMLDDDFCRLYFCDDRDEEWYADVQRVGGGDYAYGLDTTGTSDLATTLSLRAGQPWFISAAPRTHTLRSEAARGLLMGTSLTKLSVAPSQNFGVIDLDNPGDLPAPAVWTAYGPGSNLVLRSPKGEELRWNASLASGEWVRIDTSNGRVTDNTGANRYDALADMPKFWHIPANKSQAIATMDGVAPGLSYIEAVYRPRRALVV